MCTPLRNALKHTRTRNHVAAAGWTTPDKTGPRPVAVITFREQWRGKRSLGHAVDPVFNDHATPYVWS